MHGLVTIYRKELADDFSSYRFMILFALIAMVSLILTYVVGLTLKQELEGVAKPSFVFLKLFTFGHIISLVQLVAIIGPVVGLILGFDTINRERNEGTLSKLLSQPIYRDDVINGKFLAGVTTITVMLVSIVLLVTGLGLKMVGVVPGMEEVWRIIFYLVISIIYISFWLGVAILFSILFRSVATSALAAVAVWVFFWLFFPMVAGSVASVTTGEITGTSAEAAIRQARLQKAISLASPMGLYNDATATVIDPQRKTTRSIVLMGPMEQLSLARFYGPLPLSQSLLVVVPYIITLIAITAICFAVSYTVFMRQEIRSV